MVSARPIRIILSSRSEEVSEVRRQDPGQPSRTNSAKCPPQDLARELQIGRRI